MIREFWYSDFESRLNSTHHLLVCLGGHECDCKTFSPETSGAPVGRIYLNFNGEMLGRYLPDSVEVTVSIRRTVVVHNDVDTLHIDPPTEDIRSDEDTFLECLEGSVALDTINRGMNIATLWQLAHQLHTVPPGPSPSEYLYSGNCKKQEACPIQWHVRPTSRR